MANEYDGQDNHDPIDHAIAQFHAEEGFRLLAVTTTASAYSVIVHIVVIKTQSYYLSPGVGICLAIYLLD